MELMPNLEILEISCVQKHNIKYIVLDVGNLIAIKRPIAMPATDIIKLTPRRVPD